MSRNVKPSPARQRTIPNVVDVESSAGPWGDALGILRGWDRCWADACRAMSAEPWSVGVLSERFIELVCVALSASCTNLDADATRRHIRAALSAGATRDEILFVVKCATVVAIHSLSVAAPILIAELGGTPCTAEDSTTSPPTPFCDALRATGQWNSAWDPFLELDGLWTDQFMAVGEGIYAAEVLSPKEIELLSIALDASVTHFYVPGIRRHIRAALDMGASAAEILSVLKLCVAQGVQSCNLALPILVDELPASDKP
jgi:alkylhydroperoxidase/carboxymuconolactone decarboxylase family protein YurZ